MIQHVARWMYGRESQSVTRGVNSYGCATLNGGTDIMFSTRTGGVSSPVNSAEMTMEDHELLMQMCPENQVPVFSTHALRVSSLSHSRVSSTRSSLCSHFPNRMPFSRCFFRLVVASVVPFLISRLFLDAFFATSVHASCSGSHCMRVCSCHNTDYQKLTVTTSKL